MLGSSDFQRVKTLWQTRIGRSKSRESQEAATTPAPELEYRQSVLQNKVQAQTPHTPALDADYELSIEYDPQFTKPEAAKEAASVSPASSSSTSASTESPSSPKKQPTANPVSSMFRTFSDVCVFPSKPPAPTSVSSTLLSIPTPWRSHRSSTVSSNSSSFSFASVGLTSVLILPPRQAAENAINNVHNVCSRCRTAVSNSISRGSPYGELVVVDVLEPRGLAIDRDESGADLPFAVTMQLGRLSRKTKPVNRDNFLVNERFVFWLESSPTIDQRTLDIFVHGNEQRNLGEVHLSLAMPVNEAFADWYPLVCRADGLKHGSMRVSMRRLVLTSSPMLQAAKTLGEPESCLCLSDRERYGELLPELWECFPGTDQVSMKPRSSSNSKEEDISSKLGRLIGFEQLQRDIF